MMDVEISKKQIIFGRLTNRKEYNDETVEF